MAVDPEAAATAFRQALELWRGQALSDLAYEPFAQAEIARLEERRLAAFEARVESELALGRQADLVPELEAAVARHPLSQPASTISSVRHGSVAAAIVCASSSPTKMRRCGV